MKLMQQLSGMNHFTANEISIATYILAHKDKVLPMSIQELAKATYTSHSAINRLIRKLGLAGYKDFILTLSREFQLEAHAISNVDANYPFGHGESPLQVAREIAELMKETIEKNFAYLENAQLAEAADVLNRAGRIFIYALGDSEIRAKSFQNKLIKINKYPIIATELSEWEYHTVNASQQDCALFLTYHGLTANDLKAAQVLSRKHIPFITITAAHETQLAKLSTLCIQVPKDEVKHAKIGTFSSQIAFEYVLNVIYSCIYTINYAENKEASRQVLQDFYSGEPDPGL
ncbi:MurR/RpiR family transcriptional regulator [Paenibacillus sp. MMS20-IR301]|uniref:MurR/RpiR family transcriptional regulator n=1 Tax=Paenibacillus sp. MMS20-IR301 TaxID=2895946 RepID=UPI0028E898A2|nr:MurR/RpiR family transcriptional regulator [Paenibacillus sp. MMS20-IR301]WNS45294.1 MurR/RpiR family transcriptional regulator [Paenibacillus sp. MMS20-IR301]